MITRATWRKIKATAVWLIWLTNLAVIVWFWQDGNLGLVTSGSAGLMLLAVGRLAGMLATFFALTQFVVMGRQGWLEPIFGLDKLAIFHRRNGIATLCLVLLHPFLIVLGNAILSGQSPLAQYLEFVSLTTVALASFAVLLLLLTVGSSIYIARKHLKFETWYAVHLANYLAVVLFAIHQFVVGSDLQSNTALWYYWLGLYVFTALNIVAWRWILPLVRSRYFGFRVDKVVAETPTANSVYITGRNMQNFKARGGQFVMVRFLAKSFAWQEHPFSLSMLPNGKQLRLTIRALGDFTNAIPKLKKGTRVIVSGPHGAYTHDRQVTDKVVYIAGGIGITPIRSLIEERSQMSEPGDSVLIYGNRTQADTALLAELQKLGAKINMPIYNVLSEQPGYKGEKGYVDGEKIARLVPDIIERDVYLCGPPPMMRGIIAALTEMGVPKKQIHYERFALHKQ